MWPLRIALAVFELLQPVRFSVIDAASMAPEYPVGMAVLGVSGGHEVVLQGRQLSGDETIAILRTAKIVRFTAATPDYATAGIPVNALLPETMVRLVRFAELSGIVRDEVSKLPIRARVQVISGDRLLKIRNIMAGDDGQFRIKCEPGNVQVSVWAPSYSQVLKRVALSPGEMADLDISLPSGVTLRGTFTGLRPASIGASIEARPSAPPAMIVVHSSVRNNQFDLKDLSVGGSYTLRFSSSKCPPTVIGNLKQIAAANQVATFDLPACELR